MRRVASSAILLLLLSGIVTPILQAGVQPVPACCRVGGAHHCMGLPQGDGFHAAPVKCPYQVNAIAIDRAAIPVASTPSSQRFVVLDQTTFALPSIALTPDLDGASERGPPVA